MKPKQTFRRRASPAEVPFLWNEFNLPALRRDLRCYQRQWVFEELNESAASCIRGEDHFTGDLRRFLFAAPQSLALAQLPPRLGQIDWWKTGSSSAARETANEANGCERE